MGAVIATDYKGGLPVARTAKLFWSVHDAFRVIDSLLLRSGQTVCVCHNASVDLTLAGLWEWVDNGWATLEYYVIDDPPTIIVVKLGERVLYCVDLLNYWRKDLATIADKVGAVYADVEPAQCSALDAADAAELHALVTAQACDKIIHFLYQHLGGGWKPTAAGIAWSAFRSRKWGDHIHVHCDQEATRLERSAYYGGIVKAYQTGQTVRDITAVDVNNLYGWAMHQYTYPVRLLRVGNATGPGVYEALRSGTAVVAAVRIQSQVEPYPLTVGDTTVYTVGTFDTVLAGPELFRACRSGTLATVYEAAFYETGLPFPAYVEHWYTARLESREQGNQAGAALAKLITSTLFGRLGQRGRHWVKRPDVIPMHQWGVWHQQTGDDGKWQTFRALAGVVQACEIGGEGKHTAVAIAAYVTAYARERMLYLRNLVGTEHVMYEDTDCLHVDASGYATLSHAGLLSPTRLGSLKVVGRFHEAIYYGPKSYETDGAITQAGLSASARAIADGVWLQDKKAGLQTLPQRGPRACVYVDAVPFERGG